MRSYICSHFIFQNSMYNAVCIDRQKAETLNLPYPRTCRKALEKLSPHDWFRLPSNTAFLPIWVLETFSIGGLHMTSSKTWLCKLWSICSKFCYSLQDHTTCLCTKFELIWINENRVTGQRSWRIFYNVVWENNGLVGTLLPTNMAAAILMCGDFLNFGQL